MAKRKAVDCYVCNNTYYVKGRKNHECPFCEERKLQETNPEAYKEWQSVKRRNSDLDRKLCDYYNMIDIMKGQLIIGLPVLLFLIIGTIYDSADFKENLASISYAYMIGITLVWAIKIARTIYRHDFSVWRVTTKRGEFIRDEIGDPRVFGGAILGGIVLLFLVEKFFIKSDTDGYITRRCIIGFSLFAIELLITAAELIITIRAKVKASQCKRKIVSIKDIKNKYRIRA